MDCPIEKIIYEKDKEVFAFISNLDEAICMVDDLVDHKANPSTALTVLIHLNECMEIISNRPELYRRIEKNFKTLIAAEVDDISFVPMQRSNQDELQRWIKRGYRSSVTFDCLCYLDSEYDTKENWSWILETQTKGMILNDCSDILNGEFEDFHQTRRNYVALSYFTQDIYYNWKSNKEDLIKYAAKIRDGVKFESPRDDKIIPVYENLREQYGML